MDNKPTQKQIEKINKLIYYLGRETVVNYITNLNGFKNTNIDNLTKKQAQKIITGLALNQSKPIFRVYGRDIFS